MKNTSSIRFHWFGWWPTAREWRVLAFDARQVLTGHCNNKPWRGAMNPGGGYSHWRCHLPFFHAGSHRSRNYTWDGKGRANYDPLPVGERFPGNDRQPPGFGHSYMQRRRGMREMRKRDAAGFETRDRK